ncbi:beta strand repeat-containing protein, partial [Flavobacterium paronense]
MITHLLKKLLVLIVILISCHGNSQNLLNNGGFETGTVIGYFVNAAAYTQLTPPFSGTTASGNFAITKDPQPVNTTSFISGGDHTSGTGYMLVFDGNTTAGQQNFWDAGTGGSGVCGMIIGGTYTFSYWVKSIATTVTNVATQADIRVQILNASSITLVSGNTLAPLPASGWQQVVYTFVPTSNCVNIKLYDNNKSFVGNDFAIDDMSVTAPLIPLSLAYTSSNSSCPNGNTGTITAAASNGVLPYVSYNLTGPITPQTNPTGFFTGLPPGTYSVSVTDSAGTTVSQPNIVITEPTDIVTSGNVAICLGDSTTLTVSGGVGPYNWTAAPADPTLITPSPNPTVTPTQTTVYTVTPSITTTINLIANGNFSSGNVGFTSSYSYFTPSNAGFVQKAYGIVTNANSWEVGFSAACVDHTSGTGQMMVVDGSTTNGGNDLVWGQNVTVNPGQNYTFSYWVQTVSAGSPAIIRTVINGTVIGSGSASATVCGWTQYSYVWNSGASTLAQIQLFDSVVAAGGNDFTLDDIALTTNSFCNLSKTITVTVNSSTSPVITCGTATSTSVTFNWAALAGTTGYAISYSINGGLIINPASITSTTYTVNGLNPNDSVKIFVTPIGTGCYTASNATCVSSTSLPCPIPVPLVSVTQQPTCTVPTGTIVFTSPLNTPFPAPSELFISEVTDADSGSLTYIEIYNGTGSSVNLANYKLKIFNNGNGTPSTNCDFALSGTLLNNAVVVVAVGSATNLGNITPNLVFASCGGINNNDNIRLSNSADVVIDLWGDTTGTVFTPANSPGYTYRRNVQAPHPSLVWNPADWTSFDPEDYTDVGSYQMSVYEYSVNGTTYQSSPTFTGLAPNTYNVTIRDLISGCVSNPIALTVNPVPTIVAPTATATVQPSCTIPTGTIVVSLPLGANYNYSINGVTYQASPTFSGLTPNTYPVTVRNIATGCTSTATNVTINAAAAAPNVSASTLSQANCTVKLTGNSTNIGVTITWNGPSLPVNSPNPSTATVSGTYTVTVLDPLSGCSSSTTVNVVIPNQPSTPIVTITQPTCTVSTGSIVITSPLGANLVYSIDGTTYQASPTFSNLSPGNYSVTVKDSVSGCISPVLAAVINPVPVPPTAAPVMFCDGPTTNSTQVGFDFNSIGQNSFTYSYTIAGGPPVTGVIPFSPSSYIVTGVTQGQAVTLTITWNGVCAPSLTRTCYASCLTPVTPTFTAVAPICSGQTLTALPTTSLNAITGTWSPALNNTTTTTYTFTPATGQCAATTTLQIVVNPNVIPTFTAVGSICSGQTLSALPTTSLNGITGTWSPALNNTTTTTYTFTPTAGLCAQNTTMQIVVNPNVTPTFTAITPICTGQTLAPLPTTSNNGITGTWSPALNNTATTLYTFTPSAGQCATTATLTITVNGNTIIPTFTAVAPICSGQTLLPLPTTSLNGILGTWSPALNNTTTTTYTFAPNSGQCALTKTLTITVNGNTITPTFTAVAPICSGQTLSPLPTTSNNGINGSWSPALNNTATTTYTFTPAIGQCALTTTLQIVVNPNIVPTFNAVAPICSGQTLSALPTTSLNAITGVWSPALNNTATTTYTFTPTAGQCATSKTLQIQVLPIVVPTFNTVSPICSGAVLAPLPTTSLNGISGSWSPALNNTITTTYTFLPNVGQCANSATIQIQVIVPVVPTLSIVESCNSNTVTVTNPIGANFQYSLDGLPYQSSPIFNNLAPGNHSIVSNQIPANCVSNPANFIINTIINDVVVNQTPLPLQICDPNNDGYETFDLTLATNSITGGNPYNVSFHETIDDATLNGTTIPNPASYPSIQLNSQLIYVRVESTVTSCYEIVQLQLVVNPTPVATEPDAYELCDYTGAVGYETFD